MIATKIVVALVIALAFIVVVAGIYFYARDLSLAEIRADVYQMFLEAEHRPELVHKGKQKMKWVLSRARSLLPPWLQLFITDEFLERVVQGWFDAVKDLLDDGKFNHSEEEQKDVNQ